MSVKDKERVAIHEMGHALVALTAVTADPVHRVSIIPRGAAALGMTMQRPLEDRYLLTEPELKDRLAVLLGGRTAEEILFDLVVSTGAGKAEVIAAVLGAADDERRWPARIADLDHATWLLDEAAAARLPG